MATMTFTFTVVLSVPEGGPTQGDIINKVMLATHYNPEEGITKQRHYEKVIAKRLKGDYMRGVTMEIEEANEEIIPE